MITFLSRGDNDKFVQSSLKKLKKLWMKYPDLKQASHRQYHIKKSKRKHDAICKVKHIRQKFGDVKPENTKNT